jgi:acetyltransferase-like isoleucine patch superfamily enzyme
MKKIISKIITILLKIGVAKDTLLSINLKLKNKVKIQGNNNDFQLEGFIFDAEILIKGNNNKLILKKGAVVSNVFVMVSGNNNVIFLDEKVEHKQGKLWIEGNNCQISIGKQTTIEGAIVAAVENNSQITIGEDCMFSTDIEIRTSDSHSIVDATIGKRLNPAKSIKIGNHVWLGAKVLVLKGSQIDDNSVVGIASIVTKHIPANSLAVGAPAKVLKENINWSREII